ncbi:hypothetical protein G6O69_15520 [Pseudenhygromyxa sp. WMMC2535]|uniref:hypothetical protein n=1 Tax=Pseudenhygromyxa sp. WMMC2535 TaxID=2712867 RepID=UPI001552B4AF|nr:hypothetical protein [Pseudenhygromyxa sp. WMMC2535]NVB39252.1 hypothetical protein [Pseudenhygromyxa sp. WMMC2535]
MTRRLPFLLPALPLISCLALACSDDGGASDDEATSTAGTETADTGTDSEVGSSGTETETADTGTDTGLTEPEPEVDWATLECDSLVPEYCLYPFPNNVFTAEDAATPTGRRVSLVSAQLPSKNNVEVLADPFNMADGFSAGQVMLTYMPNVATTGLATWKDIDASLDPASPTVIINAETGEWVPHFAEVDVSLPADTDGSLMIRPVERLADNTRYIVAVRDVQNESGELIPASADFATLRDLTATDNAELEARRPLYADIFARLADAGVERESLQIAWDFTTASTDNNTASMLHMRDEAMASYAEGEGPSYMVTNVENDWNTDNIAYRIQGTIEVPLYLDSPDAGGKLVYGADGLPEQQGTAEYPFVVIIPNSALEQPAQVMQYGHGLLGGIGEASSGHLRSFLNEYNYIIFAVDWIGMADEDAIPIAQMLNEGSMHQFEQITDRLQQGMLNFLLGTRMMRTSFANDPSFGEYIDPSAAHYWGISQGGIFGGTFLALSQDIERGCVEVPGQPYNLLLNRSVDFDQYFALLQAGFGDSRDLQILLALMQMLWDHAEPTGYSHRATSDLFPDTPAHDVLIRAAVGDHQVTTLGAHIMARAMGATHLDTGIRDIWGLDTVSDENAGTTYVEYAFGLPEDPLENVPQESCEDPHGELRKLEAARAQLDAFFRTGVVGNYCDGGVCDYPELGACP